jgi:hypothetical protein
VMWARKIEEHYRNAWQAEPQACAFSAGPIHQLPDGFSVLRVPPHGSRTMWTYATRCMSVPGDAKPIELHLFSPHETDEVVELLVATAHFHRTSTRLDIGHSVNFGKPWIGHSECRHGLVSLPYLDGRSLEILHSGSGTLNCYWLIPITSSEVEYKKKHGLDALEAEFDRSGFDYVNPQRRSVVS